ncbi:MAG: NAD(P)-dependent oxidoreductase [Rhodospirillaceae bacterium]|nr:NAD(P)-dependent oxidoreductase [Rhodospirillaceae bacterium]
MKNMDVIGVAGCGTMGLPMAERLLAAGVEVWGFDVRPAEEFGAFGARMINDASEFRARVDTVFSVVRDRHQTFDLCVDDQAVFVGADAPTTLVVSSTLSPRILPEITDRLPDGAIMIDAPMSGAPARAADGTLTFMVGGPDKVVSRMMPLFNEMGTDIHHLGATGTGMTCKVINNFVGATGVAAVRKAISAARALGLDPAALLDVMKSSSGATWYGDNLDRISWAREGYDPANTIGILEKDMLSFLDAVEGDPSVGVDSFGDAVLDIIREMEPLEL